jgi:RHS repeat-associated protein
VTANLSSITTNGVQQSPSYTATNSLTSGTYDANGSPTALGGNGYTWDGANRIVSFSGTANNSSSFTYDGLGRLVRIVDTSNGSVIADHSYLWCGRVRCLAHDNTQSGSPVSTQYFDQGVIVSGTPYYYVKDQLGSVRQLVTTSGSVAAQYDYDPYGNPTTVSGTVVADIGYGGYFYHPGSGLEFALFRAYDPTHARWLNRDPIAEAGGINLYAYADGNPISFIDPMGWSVGSAATCFFAGAVSAGPNKMVRQGDGYIAGVCGSLDAWRSGIGVNDQQLCCYPLVMERRRTWSLRYESQPAQSSGATTPSHLSKRARFKMVGKSATPNTRTKPFP